MFGGSKFARLQEAKRRWDPDNRFRFNSTSRRRDAELSDSILAAF